MDVEGQKKKNDGVCDFFFRGGQPIGLSILCRTL